jgi:hypothetical protein
MASGVRWAVKAIRSGNRNDSVMGLQAALAAGAMQVKN